MEAVRSPAPTYAAATRYAICEHDGEFHILDRSNEDAAHELLLAPSVAYEAFLGALASIQDSLAKYRPDQPRVPAGNGRQSGEWTTGDYGGGASSGGAPKGASETHNENIQVVASYPPTPSWFGSKPNAQHDLGVKQAIASAVADGYQIYSTTPLAVNVRGFTTPRVYDFIIVDPNTGNLIGVEVKTTQFDTISVNPIQVAKDIALMENGGAPLAVGGRFVRGIDYVVTCKDCSSIDIRSTLLREALKDANVRFRYSTFGN